APAAVPELDLWNGILTGSGALTVTGTMTWTGGTMSSLLATGTTTVAASASFDLSGQLTLDKRNLVNAGEATWSGQGQYDQISLTNGATIVNLAGATFTIANDRTIECVGQAVLQQSFQNAGTLVKAGSTGETDFVNVALDNSGALRQESGSL